MLSPDHDKQQADQADDDRAQHHPHRDCWHAVSRDLEIDQPHAEQRRPRNQQPPTSEQQNAKHKNADDPRAAARPLRQLASVIQPPGWSAACGP